MAIGQGTATIDFGAAPGTNTATVTITGQAGITAPSYVEAWFMGNDSTADHNAYEHKHVLPQKVKLSVDNIVAGTGFDITATALELRLNGTIKCRFVWST